MEFRHLRIERRDRVAVVTLDRPAVHNALSRALIAELAGAVRMLDGDDGIRVLVLSGGPRVFAAGADIAEMAAMDAAEAVQADFSGCCEAVAACRKPVIAAVAGPALGGGCELVEMCDLVIAADSARFAHPEVTVGVMPGAGGTQRLTRVVGRHKAMDLCLTGRPMDAAEAERAGLVSRVVPAERLMIEALAVAAGMAALPLSTLVMVKEAVGAAASVGLAEGLRLERRLFHLTFAGPDRREGMAAFLEKRAARFL